MRPRTVSTILLCLLLVGCRRKERTFEEKVGEGLSKVGVAVPAATKAPVAIPHDGVLVFVFPDRIALDSISSVVKFVDNGLPVSPDPVVLFDPTRAATTGVDDKFKRAPGDPLIVPLANALSSYDAKDRAIASIVASGQLPEQLFKEVRATLAAGGCKELYRLVRTTDGKLSAEALSL